jgi:RNA polymerase sigma factor (sigma-70 family)
METSTQADEFFMRIYRTRRNVGELRFKPGQVEAELNALDPRQAEAMRLHYLERLTQKDVAIRMGICQQAVSKLLSKGRKALLAQLAC